MNAANDRDEQVAQFQRKDGSLDNAHCIEKAGSGAIIAPLLRIDGLQTGTTTSQSQLKDDSIRSNVQKGSERTAAHDPPLPVGKDAAGMPPSEIVIPLKRARGDQEALNTKKRTKTAEELEPVVEKDLNDVASSAESVEESEKGIERFNDADVLAGRGGSINVHPGNVKYRMLIDQRRKEYLQARKSVKPEINKSVVNIIRRKYGGRFLKREMDGLWYEIGDARAQEKVGQAFRQKAPEMRKILFGEEKGPSVEFQELQQAQEQQANQVELQHLLQQRHRQQLEQQVQQQQQLQLHQHPMALATASQGTPAAANPTMLMLVNPLLQLHQPAAMTNPLLNALFMTNNTMAPVVYPVIQVPTSTNTPLQQQVFPTATDNNAWNVTPEGLQQALSGTGGHVLPKPPPPPGNEAL